MARKASALVNWSQYLPLRITAGLLQCFSPGQNLHTAAGIGSLLYRSNKKRQLRTHENLRLSFPEWDEANVRETAERSYQSMVQLAMVDALIMTRILSIFPITVVHSIYIRYSNVVTSPNSTTPTRAHTRISPHQTNGTREHDLVVVLESS